ncbi:MAG: hypothetical protein K6G81_06630 [Lachnospiraceae bacterium]|nr:hypothetical protein [Lachnospiraceae bacterium]
MKKLIEIAKYACVFAVSAALLLMLLVATEFIDKDTMKANMLSSAKTMCENTAGVELWQGVAASKLDFYADCISLNIAWHTDREHPFASAMWSSYSVFRDPADYYGVNYDLYDTVSGGLEANTQYLRYWHGSAVFIRLFHLFTDITGMYAIAAFILLILFILLMVSMWKLGMKGEAAGLVLASVMAAVWFVPLCLEYYWVFPIAFGAALLALNWGHKGRWELIPALFMVSGILTNYLDFLTTEILTLLIPLLLLLALSGREGFGRSKGLPGAGTNERIRLPGREGFRQGRKLPGAKTRHGTSRAGQEAIGQGMSLTPAGFSVKVSILWGVGYLGMWVTKWVIASAILKENALPYVTEHIAQRAGLYGDVAGNPLSAVFINLITILPAGLGDMGAILCVIALIALGSVWFVYKKKSIRKEYVIVYAVAGLIPYLRYAVLNDHSFRHFFFTYRAQMATVLALCLITLEVTGLKVIKHKAR